MAHRFSNSTKIRQEVLDRASEPKFETWEDVPQNIRILILEHITLTIQEVLREV